MESHRRPELATPLPVGSQPEVKIFFRHLRILNICAISFHYFFGLHFQRTVHVYEKKINLAPYKTNEPNLYTEKPF